MKLLLLFTIFFIINVTRSDYISYTDLVKIKGIYYKKETENAFTGKIEGILKGTFKNGMKHGEFIKYYDDGKILSKVNYFENKLNGNWIEYFRNGNVLSKKNFKDDLLDGQYIDYYSFGQVLSRRYYVKNKLEGIYEEFHKNGQLYTKKNYKNDILEGEYITYHEYELNPVVQIKSKKYYRNGKIDGKFIEFDENGNKRKDGFYFKGRLEGEVFIYNKLGKIVSTLVYKEGLLIETILND